jgi:hypothetical protein
MTVGGWSEFHSLTKDEEILFKEVMGNILGVSYKPIVVSTQVVSGMNYCFICRATSATNPPKEFNAEVYIYKPAGRGEKPYCTAIHQMTM